MGADSELRAAWRAYELSMPIAIPTTGRGSRLRSSPDLLAMQEIIWRTRPEVIVETGIAHGGSLIFSASMLSLLGGDREVIGIDIDIRAHNRSAIEAHPLASKIAMFEGSSIDTKLAAEVRQRVGGRPAMVVLDSNHTADHVAAEIELYAPLVRAGHYLIVMDTSIELVDAALLGERPWGPGNSPMTAVNAFLARDSRFVVDEEYDAKLRLTVAPGGYLRALRDP